MPTVTVYIAGRGTPLAQGGTSNAGHMWLALTSGDGAEIESYGFSPAEDKATVLPVQGRVRIDDSTNYLSHEYARTIEVTQSQFDQLKAFGDQPEVYGFDKSNYFAPTNSCIDFVWKALEVSGLNPTGYQGSLWPTANKDDLRKFIALSPGEIHRTEALLASLFPLTWEAGVDVMVNSATTAALNWVPPRRDPLVLDLDGGGIKTSAINPNSPILFDQDGDGIKTATGWIGAGEAIVVRDLNGNGTIDSGRELFGDNTLLTRGPRAGQVAAHGFEALADLDSNGDGQFNNLDAAFASVKLWKDTNQDGLSAASELFSFAALGVASIKVTGTSSNINLGGGNTQTFAGTFTRASGADGVAGTAELAGSLLLANNNFFSSFSDDPTPTEQALSLPQMRGSGMVRDLHSALSLGTNEAADLQAKLTQFAQGSTRAEQLAVLDSLIQAWGRTSAMPTSVHTNRTLANTGDSSLLNGNGPTAIEKLFQDNPTLYVKITTLEQFNGQTILDKWVRNTTINQIDPTTREQRAVNVGTVVFSEQQEALIDQAYDALSSSVYGALVMQTRLKPYIDSIRLSVDDRGVWLDPAAAIASVKSGAVSDAFGAVADWLALQKYIGSATVVAGWHPYEVLAEILEITGVTADIQSILTQERVVSAGRSGLNASAVDSGGAIVLGNSANNELTGGAGADRLYGAAGADILRGGDGNDILAGGTGNDVLYGGGGEYSGGNSDVYLFNLGDGVDMVVETVDYYGVNTDVVRFGAGIAPADIVVARAGNHLELRHVNGADKVIVQNWFWTTNPNYGRIEQVQFSDGTVWTGRDLQLKDTGQAVNLTGSGELVGTALADTLISNGYGTSLQGGAGNDRLVAGIVGGSVWNLTFNGGPGNDLIIGSYAKDTFIFNRGDGWDTLSDDLRYYPGTSAPDYFASHPDAPDYQDRVQFGSGIDASQVWFQRASDDLKVSIIGTPDGMTIAGWYTHMFLEIEEFRLQDGRMLRNEHVDQLVAAMADVSRPLVGETTLPTDTQLALMGVINAYWL